ncbi:MAG: hypothetical protein ABI614_04650, partial [Planctomycetota bacterium]
MVKFFSVMLVAFAVSTPAHAQVFGFLSSNGGPEQMMDGNAYAPTQSAIGDQPMQGYPFYSGCCDSNGSSYAGLWDGYCGSKGCGTKAHCGRHHGGMKGGCGTGCGDSMCGKGGCGHGGYGHGSYKFGVVGYGGYGYPAPYQFGGKSGWSGHASHHGGGGKGCDPCDPCAPKHHCRLGLFDWMHFGRGHGCNVCGGAGCSSCDGGKGGFSKGGYIEQAPVQGYDKNYYGTPTEAQENNPSLQPPEVLVEPTPVSDRSAWRRP